MPAKNTQVEFYDRYVETQTGTGTNERHHAILRFLKRHGLRKTHHVLEVGCGIGTLTGLLAGHLAGRGELTAIDLSPKSIAAARRRLARRPEVRLLTGDILDLELDRRFDVVVLPDVLEHIPLPEHPLLFRRLHGLLKEDGFIFIHLPEPRFLAWSRVNEPENLQIIDQPVPTDRLLADAYPAGLYLDFLCSYRLWRRSADYQVVILRSGNSRTDYSIRSRSIYQRLRSKLQRLWRENFSR